MSSNTAQLPPISKNTFKYTWLDSKNSFKLLQNPAYCNPYQSTIIQNTIKEIEKKSGIKKRSFLLSAILLVLFASAGFFLGFILIVNSLISEGGIALILTPLLAYFIVVGYEITRGTQVSRFNSYMEKHRLRLRNQLQSYGIKLGHAVNKCKN